MYKNTLLNSASKYLSHNKNFYDKCIEALNKISYENELLFITPKNKYVLECMKCAICDNPVQYHIYVYNKKKSNCTNYQIKVTDKIKNVFFNELPKIHFKNSGDLILMNIIIADRQIAFNDISYEIKDIDKWCTYSTNDYAKLFVIKKIFGYSFSDTACFPNMTIQDNNLVVFNDRTIDDIYKKIEIEVRDIYGLTVSRHEIKKYISKCHEHGFDIYNGVPEKSADTEIVKKFHLDVKRTIYNQYCRGINNLFDAGCGRLTDLFYWNEAGIKNVYCVEPSKDSIQSGKERHSKVKNKIRTNVLVVEGVGDTDWSADKKYAEINNKKYDVITFQFTFHYMIDKLNVLMKNLTNISKHGTKIIITCMDGNLIHNDLNKHEKIEVRNNKNEIIFAINDTHDDNILVYLKGGYGMEHGSIEKIVNIDKIIKIFAEHNYKLIIRKPFLEYDSHIKNQMSPAQKNISKYYTSVIFEYI